MLCWKSTAPDLLELPTKRIYIYILDTFLFARKCLLLGNVKNRETSEHMALSTPTARPLLLWRHVSRRRALPPYWAPAFGM